VQAVVDLIGENPGPLIAPVDFNATDRNTAYRMIVSELSDSWREVGWGFGHTFPGSNGFGSRFHFMGVPLPRWLLRIDYVFHSEHWQAESAVVGPWDGVSDHRPVVVTLRLVERADDRVIQE
jgi:endonuclease/exonuclease/phosphatase (EEP) superfamily protein YafD